MSVIGAYMKMKTSDFLKKKCPTCNQFHKLRYTCLSCCRPLERVKAQYYWRGAVMHGWVCPNCNSLWDIGGAFVKYVAKRTKKDGTHGTDDDADLARRSACTS